MPEPKPDSEKPIPDDAWPAIFAELGLVEEQREAQVLPLLMDFKTDGAIGRRLGISPKTVGRHVSRLMHRVGAKNRSDLLVRVVQIAQRIQSGGGRAP